MTTSTNSEKVGLVDTNVLVYRANLSSPFHAASANLIQRGLKGEIPLCIAPQNLTEFYAVVTSPKRVSVPISPTCAIAEIEQYLRSGNIRKIYQTAFLLPKLLSLIKAYSPTRQQIFDLQLVATMLINGVTCIYTFNDKHFVKYSEIEVIVPK